MESPSIVRWETITKSRFDAIDRPHAVVLLTCSPLEVHGPHLPLGADLLEGEGIAGRMLRFLPERHRNRTFLKLPFFYAASDVVPQPGSLYFRPSTTVRFLEDLGRTLAAQGFTNVILSSFHGGPRHFLSMEKACDRVSRRHGIRMVSLFSLLIGRLTGGSADLSDVLGSLPGVKRTDLEGDTHGGLVETSQLLALHGDWVDPDHDKLPRMTPELWLASRGEARPEFERGKLRQLPRMLRAYRDGLAFFREQTYSGAPGAGSAELGELILDTLGAEAATACTELLDGTIGPDDCHSPVWRLRFLFLNPVMIWLTGRLMGFRNPLA